MSDANDQLFAFGTRLAERRGEILRNWERRVAADPKLLTGNTLPIAQLHDHLTAVLEDFERRLCTAGASAAAVFEETPSGDAAAHGLHRWHQGFDLAELVRELGRLNESVVAEIDRCAAEPALQGLALLSEVHRLWAALYSVATTSSAEQYFKLQQLEAAGHVKDLEDALESLRALESQRALLWQEAAHDLRGNLSVVTLVTAGLASGAGGAASTERFLASLTRNVSGLQNILQDVTSLARIQGGQEVRVVSQVDVSRLLHELVEATDGLAHDRRLFLRAEGPDAFAVEGDATKIRRIVQNLTLNALRYTERGGVTVRWGLDPEHEARRWFVEVQDTGPGLQTGPGSFLAGAISIASDQARDVAQADADGRVAHVDAKDASPVLTPDQRGRVQKSGEGLGLSIVKRLCTLLDATIQLDSVAEAGTTFRILLPLAYDSATTPTAPGPDLPS